MRDFRLPYEEALSGFLEFLKSQGWSTDLRWLTGDRISSHHRTHWLFRPEDMISDAISRAHYERTCETDRNIRIDAHFAVSGCTVAAVHALQGNSRFLNYGIFDSLDYRVVRNRAAWNALRFFNKLRGGDHFDEALTIPQIA